jgi:hypothetical protein
VQGKNRPLDDDEFEFLDNVANAVAEQERTVRQQEEEELATFHEVRAGRLGCQYPALWCSGARRWGAACICVFRAVYVPLLRHSWVAWARLLFPTQVAGER